jgi:hypothetical protein
VEGALVQTYENLETREIFSPPQRLSPPHAISKFLSV